MVSRSEVRETGAKVGLGYRGHLILRFTEATIVDNQ